MPITRSRCDRAGEIAVRPPMPTAMAVEAERKVGSACRQERQRTQVMLINDYRLNLVDPEARTALERQIRALLSVPANRPE